MARLKSEREIRISAEFHCLRLRVWSIIFLFFGPIFLWLDLFTADQAYVTCSIQDFYVPALSKSANATTDHSIYFDLKLQNGRQDMGIYYDTLNLTFYLYGENKDIINQIANHTLQGFYQGHQKNTHRRESVRTHGIPSSNNGSIFRVDLATAVRFKDLAWKGKTRHLMVGADVEVDGVTGKKVKKEGITLEFDAPEIQRLRRRAVVGLLLGITAFVVLLAVLVVSSNSVQLKEKTFTKIVVLRMPSNRVNLV